MAASRRADFAARAILIAAVLGFACASVTPAQERPETGRTSEQPISINAASSEVDYRTGTVAFRDIIVSQGGIRVVADTARVTGLGGESSRWTFEGDVRIDVDGGRMSSDRATVDVRNSMIANATVNGAPAQFEQQLERSGTLARGRAGTIEYDVGAGSVTLSDDAWLSDGRSEIRGELLVYDVGAQRVQAQSREGEDDRVRITIKPRATTPPAEPAPEPDAQAEPTR
jgi:lipopolysaccharide transport protein LptA